MMNVQGQKPMVAQFSGQQRIGASGAQFSAPQVQFGQQQPQIKFGASNGFWGGLKKLFAGLGAWMNWFGNASQNPVVMLQNRLDGLGQEREQQKKIRHQIVGSYTLAKEELGKAEKKLAKEQAELNAALDALDREEAKANKDARVVAALNEAIKIEAGQVQEQERLVETARKAAERLELAAEAAKAKDKELEGKMKELAGEIKAAMSRVKETEQNRQLAQLNRQLEGFMNSDFSSDNTSRAMERINREFHESQAALDGTSATSAKAEDIIAAAKAKEAIEASQSDDFVAKLRAKRKSEREGQATEAAGGDVVTSNTAKE